MDPRRSFGQSTVRNVRSESLAEDYRAGTGRDELADLYDLTLVQVDAAIRFELIAGAERAAAHNIFGTSGKVLFQNGVSVGNGAREYPACAAWGSAIGKRRVQVQYSNYAARGGPMRVVFIQYY